MAGLKELALGRSDLFRVDPRQIKRKADWNVRVNDSEYVDHIRWLADSIKEIGVKQPLTVYMEDGEMWVSDGFSRLAACDLAIEEGAELKTVPVIVEDRYASEADRVLSLITRNAGKPLKPIEKAAVYKRLYDLGWQPNEIAKKAGVTQAHVLQILELSAAPEAVKEMVRAGEMSASTAREIVREAGNGHAAVEAAQEAVQAAKAAGKKRAVKPAKAKADALFFGILRNAFGCIDDRGATVVVEIERDDYDRIMAVLGGSA